MDPYSAESSYPVRPPGTNLTRHLLDQGADELELEDGSDEVSGVIVAGLATYTADGQDQAGGI
jgi:hypothetical protein